MEFFTPDSTYFHNNPVKVLVLLLLLLSGFPDELSGLIKMARVVWVIQHQVRT